MKDYETLLKAMPAGIDRAILRILTYHTGEAKLIRREDLLVWIKGQPGMEAIEDRQLREAIHELRLVGVRVCHTEIKTPTAKGRVEITFGYFLAKTEEEYQAFRLKYGSYARTIWQTIKAMDARQSVITPDGELEPPAERAVQQALL